MVRRHAGLSALVAAAVVLAGCSSGDPGDLPTAADYAAAQRAWADPWLAPARALVPEAGWGAADGTVRRNAGTRTTHYTGDDPVGVLGREIAAARAAGWRLTGFSCTPLAASLARGTGRDDGIVARVEVEAAPGGGLQAEVAGFVPHHRDGGWPAGPAVDADLRCEGGPEHPLEDVAAGPPYDPRDPVEPAHTAWQRSEPSADDRALAAAVDADPWVRTVGISLAGARLAADGARRNAASATRDVPLRLAAVVGRLGAWELTWIACGRGRDTEATARLATEHGAAVARLTGSGTTTTVTITLPLPEAPAPDWVADVVPLAVADAPCLAGPVRAPYVGAGTPVATVAVSQPVG